MPEKINLRINGGNIHKKTPLTLKKLTQLIKDKNYPSTIEAQLIKMAADMPLQDYSIFAKNIYKYLKQCQKDK